MHTAIVTAGVAQVAAGGAQALSLNAIGHGLGTSGPALYRYFPSRAALLGAVTARVYGQLADALEQAAADPCRRGSFRRFRSVADAYRAWANENPELYRLIFSTPAGSGHSAPDLVVPASHRGMIVMARAFADTPVPQPIFSSALNDEIELWATARDTPPETVKSLPHALRAWTRMHGVVSLELEGAFAAMGLDASRVFEAEVQSLLTI